MNRNLVGSIYGRSSIAFAHFISIRQQTWPAQVILVSDWLISKKSSSPLKPFRQMNRNLIGSILERSSIKVAHLVLIHKQPWPPQEILVSDWLISKKSSLNMPSQMNQNLIGSIIGRSSIKIAHFVPTR